jgi:hypothetical protein
MAISTWRSNFARAMAWLGLVTLALGAWLSWPRPRGDAAGAPLVVFLVDVSKSVVAPRPAFAPWIRAALLDEARRAANAREDACIVAFGSGVRTIAAPRAAAELVAALAGAGGSNVDPVRALLTLEAPAGEDATRLARALDYVQTLARDRVRTRIVLCGDGSFTGRDPASIAERLAANGARFERVAAPPAQRSDFGIARLEAPRTIEEGAPLVVSCEAWFAAGVDARDLALSMEFVRRDARGTETRTITLRPPAGAAPDETGCVRWPVHADLGRVAPGAVEVRARAVESKAGAPIADPLPENDTSTALVRCGGALTIGLVGSDEERANFTRAIGASTAGIDFVAVDSKAPASSPPPNSWAASLATALPSVDALVTVDTVLDADEAALLASFVKRGGGWLDLAGWNWIAQRAGSAPAPLAELGALDLSRPDEARDVVFLVDASGSMAGAPFESVQTALGALVDAAPARDHLEARFFADVLAPPIDLGSGEGRADPSRRRALVDRLRTAREPHGPTALWSALEALARERAQSKREALVVLLTDGRDPNRADLSSHGTRARADLAAARAKLAIFAAGDDVDRELLASLLAPGESIVDVPDLARGGAAARLAQLFERELSKGCVRAEPAMQIGLARTAPNSLASVLTPADGAPKPAWPSLERIARARARDGAEIVATADHGEPVAAIARRGLGLVVSLAFVPASDGAPAWRARGDLLAPIVRAIARGHRDPGESGSRMEPSLREEGDEIVLDGIGLDFPARAEARVAGTGAVLVFEAGRNGRDPARERSASRASLDELDTTRGIGDRDADERESGVLRVEFDIRGEPLVLALPRPRAEEFSRAPGAFVPPPAGATLEGSAGSRRAAHPFAPFALVAALVMLSLAAFLGAFSRRGA